MANPAFRVVIPRNTGDLLSLARLVYKKHSDDGSASPLNGMQDYNWTETAPKLTSALTKQEQANVLRKQAEELQKEVDLLSVDIRGSLTGSRDVLLGINKKNPKKLGDWGYEVNAAVKKASAKKSQSSK